MKRSRSIRLVLIGGLSAGTLTSCSPDGSQPLAISASNVYTNNCFLPGVGYYHAPYRAWHALPYNQYDPQRQQYFHGGVWTAAQHQSFTNISGPTVEAAQQAQAKRTDIPRSGFGSTSRTFSSIHS